MIEILNNPVNWWLLLTAVIFTLVGIRIGRKTYIKNTVEHTIDQLIKDGYLKTRGSGSEMVILKWQEIINDKTDSTNQ